MNDFLFASRFYKIAADSSKVTGKTGYSIFLPAAGYSRDWRPSNEGYNLTNNKIDKKVTMQISPCLVSFTLLRSLINLKVIPTQIYTIMKAAISAPYNHKSPS